MVGQPDRVGDGMLFYIVHAHHGRNTNTQDSWIIAWGTVTSVYLYRKV